MKNPVSITVQLGLLLIGWGVGFWLAGGRASMTALIPAWFGIAYLVFAMIGRKPGKLALAMHILAVIALVGVGMGIWRLTTVEVGSTPWIALLGFAVINALFLWLGMMSFIKMRKARAE